jgi:HAD superfamily hydrolase (TIGR01509 family)
MLSGLPLAGPLAGVVFDIDGTLLDNMPFHVEAFNVFVRNHGLPALTLETRRWMDGKRNSDIFPGLFDRPLSAADIDRLSDEKESMYRRISTGRLTPLPGLLRLLDLLEGAGVPIALATSAPHANVVHTLQQLGLSARLPTIARSDDVPNGKPFPDVFLEAARRIGAPPDRCVAFEDAPVGVVAARAAGMATVAVTTTYPRELLAATEPPPHAVVADFDEFLAGPGAWLGQTALQG